MDLAAFKASLAGEGPAPDLGVALRALWWDAKGAWETSHEIVAHAEGLAAAWVHAYLHRVEGDLGNAGYWYRQAKKPVAADPLETEWERITSTLLGSESA